ncbi:MAG1360 family OppF-related protein [Mycoplasmopsis columboralis]|nr:hypothetical protein [Mycoplasmopsis columboralis]
MKKQNLLLTMENIFNYKSKNGDYRFLNIAKIDIFEQVPTVFYINSEYNDFSYSSFWNSLIEKNATTLSLWLSAEEDKFRKIIFNKSEVNDHIDYLKLKNVVKKSDHNLPIYTVWKDCLKEYPNTTETREEIKKWFNNFEISTKNAFYNVLTQNSEQIVSAINEFTKEISLLENKIKSKSVVLSESDIVEFLENFNKETLRIQNNIFEKYLEVFQKLSTRYEFYSKNQLILNGTAQEQQIKEYKIQLKYLDDISKSSIHKVYNDLKIRDILSEIEFYKNYRNKLSTQSLQQIDLFKTRLKNQITTLKSEIKKIPGINPNKEQLYKNYFYLRSLLKLWFKNKQYFKYSSIDTLEKVNKNLIAEKIFFNIGDKKSIYKLSPIKKFFMYKELELDFDEKAQKAYEESDNQALLIQKTIDKLQKKLKKITKNSYNQITIKKNIVKYQALEQRIKLAEADLDWNKYSEQKLYKNALKNKNLKVKKLISNTKKSLKEANNFFKFFREFINSHPNKSVVLSSDEYIKFENFFTQYIDLDLFNDFIIQLGEFTLDRNKGSSKFINYFVAMIKFVKAYEYLSINNINFFNRFKDLNFLEATKFKLVKYYLNPTKVLFIEDDSNINNYNIKNEFLRVFKNIAMDNGITYVFLSEDTKFIVNNFEDIHIFYNNTAIEGGKLRDVVKNPIHPITKKIFNKSAPKRNSLLKETEDYIFNEIIPIETDSDHYVYSKYKNFKQWTNSLIEFHENYSNSSTGTFNLNLNDFINTNYQSFLENQEFLLTNFQQNHRPERKVLPLDFKNDHFETNKETADTEKLL